MEEWQVEYSLQYKEKRENWIDVLKYIIDEFQCQETAEAERNCCLHFAAFPVYWARSLVIQDCAAFVVVLGWSLLPSTTQASNPGVVVLRLLYSAMSREHTCEWAVSDSWVVASAIGVRICAKLTCSCYRPLPSTSGWSSKYELMLSFDCVFTVATDDA